MEIPIFISQYCTVSDFFFMAHLTNLEGLPKSWLAVGSHNLFIVYAGKPFLVMIHFS